MLVIHNTLKCRSKKITLGPYCFSVCVNLGFAAECHCPSETLESLSRVKTNAHVAPHRDYDLITLVVPWASIISKVLSLLLSLMIMQHSLRHADNVGTVDLDVYSFKEGV